MTEIDLIAVKFKDSPEVVQVRDSVGAGSIGRKPEVGFKFATFH